jgi:hypothetical protein
MLPTFLVIGAMKSGTTSLYRYLQAHPDVYMSEQKELNYFTEGQNWENGVAWYEAQFAGAGNVSAIGEASTNYTKFPQFPGVPERIAELLPDARLIYIMRNPIERVRSAYLHAVIKGNESRPIERAIHESPQYVDTSRYAMQIDRYLEHFPREQLLILTADDLQGRREQTMQQVFRFIGVDDRWQNPNLNREYHQTAEKARRPRPVVTAARRLPGYKALITASRRRYPDLWRRSREVMTRTILEEDVGEISADARAQLEDMVRDDVRRLRLYLGDDFDGWGIA